MSFESFSFSSVGGLEEDCEFLSSNGVCGQRHLRSKGFFSRSNSISYLSPTKDEFEGEQNKKKRERIGVLREKVRVVEVRGRQVFAKRALLCSSAA